MLLELEVKNFALIDQLHLQFDRGLNILSGETGAGKSIIIDAVNMAIGERADREFVRTGANKCSVQAIFSFSNRSEIEMLLKDYGIELEEESQLIITREIYVNGRSVSRINGTMVTQQVLKTITEKLIDIHGQHQHQSLLNSNTHIDMLDAYGGKPHQELLLKISEEYQKLVGFERRLINLCGNEMERERKIDLLSFQIKEIDDSKLKKEEEDNLNQQRLILANSEKIFEGVSKSYSKLYEDNPSVSIYHMISQVATLLHSVMDYDQRLKEYYQNIEEIQYRIQDISHDIRNYKDSIDFEPAMLDEIEERLDVINNLKRKYGKTIDEVLAYREAIGKELDLYQNSEEEIKAIREKIEKQVHVLDDLSLKLSKLRKKTASTMEKALVEILETLNMGKVTFIVDIQNFNGTKGQQKFTSKGIDQVEFLISTNVGEPPRPLAKIASGGEMSRIMLALKTILAGADNIGCLIFDEIDTGISGKTAQIVGEKLQYISSKHQVICITHLPQIASQADNHYLIEKFSDEHVTRTKVDKLNHEKRIIEIGRLLGGELSDITLKLAEELLRTSKAKKTNN